MPAKPRTRYSLMCHTCGKVRTTTPEERLTFMSKGWPVCCEEIMSLYIEAECPEDNGESGERLAVSD